jgi:predicted P-loop ATPase
MDYNPFDPETQYLDQDQSATPPIIDDQGQPATSVTADASAPTQPAVNAFNRFMDQPVWVDWRIVMRNGKRTKIPYNPNTGKKAEADDPSTWGTFDQAVEGQKHIVNGSGGGLGIEFCDIDQDYALGGLDLDTCISQDGRLEPWAAELVRRFNSYTERSPSGTGVKIFIKYRKADLPTLRKAMNGALWGKEFKRKTGTDHPPGIEVYVGHRFFTVTWNHVQETPDEIRAANTEDILWVIREAGPKFVRDGGLATRRAPSNYNNASIPGTPPALAQPHSNITTNAVKAGLANDNSRSGIAYRIGCKTCSEGKTFEEFCKEIENNADTSSWYHEKGVKNDNRELKRIWEKAKNSVGWYNKLSRSDNGKILPTLANAITAFRDSPELAGKLQYDEFQLKTVICGPLPWNHLRGKDWTDAHDVCAAEWLQRKGIRVNPDTAGQAAEKVAREHPFNPVHDYLNGLVWDGTQRLNTWVVDYLGAKDTPYHRAVGAMSMIAAVARPVNPGCQCRNVPILEGPQDLGKSKAIKTLSDPFYTEDIAALGTKDAAMQICGVWIAELSELSALNRSEVNDAKAFASRQTDRFRPPYGRRVGEFPRQGVLWGTSNNEQYLRDETGGTRWWPIRCTLVDIPGITAARDQLWAEAVHRYRAGEHWWIKDPKLQRAAKAEQDARYQADAWQGRIENLVAGKSSVTVDDILFGLGKAPDSWNRSDQMRVSGCLTSMGWGRTKLVPPGGTKQEWCYVEPGHKSHPNRQRRRKPKRR